MSDTVRVVLPAHLRSMAKVQGEIRVDVAGAVCLAAASGKLVVLT